MTLDPEAIREEGITTDELKEDYLVSTEDPDVTDVVWHDEWDEYPEERPDDVRIDERDDGTRVLKWTYEQCEIRVWNQAMADWIAEIDVAKEMTGYWIGPGGVEHEVKRRFAPHIGDRREGYVDDVELVEDYGDLEPEDTRATVRCRCTTNYQPMVCVEAMIDEMWTDAEESEVTAERMEEAFEAARGNES